MCLLGPASATPALLEVRAAPIAITTIPFYGTKENPGVGFLLYKPHSQQWVKSIQTHLREKKPRPLASQEERGVGDWREEASPCSPSQVTPSTSLSW